MKQCSKCKQSKVLFLFQRDRRGGYRSSCEDCRRAEFPQLTASAWTPERLSRLIDLVDRGFGPTEIAAELGVTKNTVSGKMSRMGIDGLRRPPDDTTSIRLDALHAKMDAALGKGLQ